MVYSSVTVVTLAFGIDAVNRFSRTSASPSSKKQRSSHLVTVLSAARWRHGHSIIADLKFRSSAVP